MRKLLIIMMMCSQAADDVRFDKMAADAQAAFLQGYLILQKKKKKNSLQRLFTQRQALAARTPCDECTADKNSTYFPLTASCPLNLHGGIRLVILDLPNNESSW